MEQDTIERYSDGKAIEPKKNSIIKYIKNPLLFSATALALTFNVADFGRTYERLMGGWDKPSIEMLRPGIRHRSKFIEIKLLKHLTKPGRELAYLLHEHHYNIKSLIDKFVN
jgi:hypothetical protein